MYRLSLYNTYNYQECQKKKKNHINNAHFTGDILNNENTKRLQQLGHWSIKTLSKNRNICSSNAFF